MAEESIKFDADDPSAEVARAYASGVVVTIKPGSLTTEGRIPKDMDPVFRLTGISDRLRLDIDDIVPDGGPPSSWPAISWVLGHGGFCVRDKRFFVSGPAPDVMTLTGADDDRKGLLYEASNFLVGQWDLYAFLPTDYTGPKFKVRLYPLADYKGGGGSMVCIKGALFG